MTSSPSTAAFSSSSSISRRPAASEAAAISSMNSGMRGTLADHLDLGVVARPVGVPQQGGLLRADVEEVGEHGLVVGPADVQEAVCHGTAGLGVARVGEEGNRVGVLRADLHLALRVGDVLGDVVLGETVERRDREARRATPVADAARERLGQLALPEVQVPQPLPGRLVEVDAGPAESAQGSLQHARSACVEVVRLEGGQLGEDVVVEVEVGAEPPGLDLELLGRLDHGRVGVHGADQRRQCGHVAQRDGDVVPQLQDGGVAGWCLLECGHRTARGHQARAGPVADPVEPGPLVGGQGKRLQLRRLHARETSLAVHEHSHRRRGRTGRAHGPAAR